MATRVTAAFRQLLRSAAKADESHTDRELLKRFASAQDQEAFAALVRRHSAMVLGVCRRALPTVQDAEDACQAVFLVLAQKAATGRWQPSIANWLYTTARRVARNARVAAQRRAKREARAAVPESVPALDQMTGRELLQALDEELARLPARYRAPLVLCYLEGLTRDQAAARLGVPPATLRSQVERGRLKLGDALTRRGVVLGAGLLALAATSPAGASPPRLTEAILATVAGKPSAAVAALAQGVTVSATVKPLLFAALLVLGAASWGAGFAGRGPVLAGQVPPPRVAAPNPPTEAPAPLSTTVSGRVLDPDGKPVTGAKLYLHEAADRSTDRPVRAVSGADGRFTFTFTPAAPAGWFRVLAAAEGYAADWAYQTRPTAQAEMTLRLVQDRPVRGRILDLEGKPVAGATLHLERIDAFADPEGFLQTVRNRQWPLVDGKDWEGPFPGMPAPVTTDADGRFQLSGVGADRVAQFRLEGPGIQYGSVRVIVRDLAAPVEPRQMTPPEGGPNVAKVYGADFTHAAAPARPIRGVVRDRQTGRPIAGVQVSAFGTTHQTQTDQDGRYELRGCGKNERGYLAQFTPAGLLYFSASVTFPDTPGLDAVRGDLELVSGIVAQGRVTHAVTGRPVAGAVVHYHPLYPNPHVARQGPNGAGTIPCSWTRAGADGTFRLVVLPGPGLLGTTAYAAQETFRPAAVTAQELRDLFQDDADHGNGEQIRIQASTTGWSVVGPGQYNAVKLINPGEKDTAVTWDATLQPAPPLKGRVVGPDGQPAAGVIAFHLAPGILSQRLEKGAFTVEGLGRQPRQVVFLDRELKHGAAVAVKADTPGPLTVRLEPCGAVGGRLLDQDGAPKAGAVVRVEATTFLAGPPTVTAQTDAAGRFRLDGLIPGMTYQVRYGPGPFGAYLGGAFVAKSGGVRELGECRLRAGP